MTKPPKKRNPLAKEVRQPKYKPRVVPDKKREEKKKGPEP
jgi:hypothetical protein